MNDIHVVNNANRAVRLFGHCLLAAFMVLPSLVFAVATPGEKAPDFSELDASGITRSLSDYEGEWLVLEWFNKDCPFTRKHYTEGNMQSLQEKYAGQGVKWVTVISSAEGKQGYLQPEQAQEVAKDVGLMASAPLVLDVDGTMGKSYGAKTTPHMFVVSPESVVVYAGAIDDNRSANPKVIPDSHNYVAAALDSVLQGESVAVASTQPYGCTVKY